MRHMMTILEIHCVQHMGPANPHWAIYYFKAIVHNRNQVIIYVKYIRPCHVGLTRHTVSLIHITLNHSGYLSSVKMSYVLCPATP